MRKRNFTNTIELVRRFLCTFSHDNFLPRKARDEFQIYSYNRCIIVSLAVEIFMPSTVACYVTEYKNF